MAPPDRLVAVYNRRLLTYRTRLSVGVAAAWDDLDDIDDEDAEEFATATTPLFSGAKVLAVAASAAFFALALKTRPVGVAPTGVAVEPRVRDPFLATWHALKEGRPPDEARLAGRSAAEAAAFDFVQSTARRTGDHVAEASHTNVRWRRVAGPSACAWCQTVAGQLYHSADSADFGHDRCDCIAVPE